MGSAHAQRFAIRISLHHAGLVKNPAHAAILVEHSVLQPMDVGASFNHSIDGIPCALAIIRVNEIRPLLGCVPDLVMGIAQHQGPLFVPVHFAGGNIPVPKTKLGPFQHEAQLFLAVLQRKFRMFAFGNVLHHGNHIIQAAIRLAHLADRQSRIDQVTILVDETLVHGIAVDLAGQHAVELGQVQCQVFGVGQLCPGHADELVPWVTQRRAECIIDLDPAFFQAGDGKTDY